MNLLLAVVAGLWYWYAMCRVGYTLQHIFCQPLVMAVPFGLIMGDLSTCLFYTSDDADERTNVVDGGPRNLNKTNQ